MRKFPIDIRVGIGAGQEETIGFEVSGSPGTVNTSGSTNWRTGIYILPTPGNIFRVDFKLYKVGTLGGTISTQIRSTSAGLPTSTVLGSSTNTVSAAGLGTDDTVGFDSSFFFNDISVSGTIAIVFNLASTTFSSATLNFVRINPANSSLGAYSTSTNSGVSWAASQDFQLQTRIWYR
jgi:hypothetical protein